MCFHSDLIIASLEGFQVSPAFPGPWHFQNPFCHRATVFGKPSCAIKRSEGDPLSSAPSGPQRAASSTDSSPPCSSLSSHSQEPWIYLAPGLCVLNLGLSQERDKIQRMGWVCWLLSTSSQWTLQTINISPQTCSEKKSKHARTPQEGTSPTVRCRDAFRQHFGIHCFASLCSRQNTELETMVTLC